MTSDLEKLAREITTLWAHMEHTHGLEVLQDAITAALSHVRNEALEEAMSEEFSYPREAIDLRNARFAQLEAECAAMREALEWYSVPEEMVTPSGWPKTGPGPWPMSHWDEGERARKALSLSAGREMLEELDDLRHVLGSINERVLPGTADSADCLREIIRERDALRAKFAESDQERDNWKQACKDLQPGQPVWKRLANAEQETAALQSRLAESEGERERLKRKVTGLENLAKNRTFECLSLKGRLDGADAVVDLLNQRLDLVERVVETVRSWVDSGDGDLSKALAAYDAGKEGG